MAAKNSRRFELKLGKTGILLFIFGMSVLVFAAFVLGVAIGKHIEAYPEEFARGFPNMIKERLGWSSGKGGQDLSASAVSDADKSPTGDEKKDFDLTFYDILNKKKGAAKDFIASDDKEKKPPVTGVAQQPPNVKEADKAPATPVTAATQAAEKLPAKPSALISNTKGASNSRPPAKETAEGKSSEAKGKYLVQVVSYRDRTKADQICDKLKAMGYKTRVVLTDLRNKGKWFRVTMIGFANRDEAQKAAGEVAKKIMGVNCVIHQQ